MAENPFADENPPRGPVNPFGDDDPAEDPARTIGEAAARIRRLRSQVGAEGLSLSGTRELLDQVARALDATARALREEP